MAGVTVTTSGPRTESRSRRHISQRLGTLAEGVHGARGRLRFDIRQLLLVGGAACIGIGFVAVIFGWYGSAHSAYVFQEIPYLISGGLLGVALVAGGGFLFFAAWIVRLLEENRRHAARVERTLDRVDRVLAAVATDAAAAAASPASMTNGVDAGSTTTTAGRQAPAGGRSE
ncbi:MAG TPA: hypothetical protein VMU09_03725 [Acidimicrobiales bacterium]|nr:hypothetical protein [Acidimicrobiales bacterium]